MNYVPSIRTLIGRIRPLELSQLDPSRTDHYSRAPSQEQFLSVMTDPGDCHFVGPLSGTFKTGLYFSPNPMTDSDATRPRRWKDPPSGVATKLTTLWVEFDAAEPPANQAESAYAMACQLRVLGRLVEWGLPMPTAIVLSSDPRAGGALGKSVHAFWRLTNAQVPLKEAIDHPWPALTKRLVRVLGADPISTDTVAVARVGGAVLPNRVQTVLHLGDRVEFRDVVGFFEDHDDETLLSAVNGRSRS